MSRVLPELWDTWQVYQDVLESCPIWRLRHIVGLVTAHGGVWYSFGTHDLQLVVKRRSFLQNRAGYVGGAFYFGDSYPLMGSTTFEDCKFIRNRGSRGGAIYTTIVSPSAAYGRISAPSALPLSKLRLVRCEFKANVAIQWGGAIAHDFPRLLRDTTEEVETMVSPPACTCAITQPISCTQCPPVKMRGYPTRFPHGTKIRIEIVGSHTGSAATRGADSSFTFNMARSHGGVISLGAYPWMTAPSMHVGAELRVRNTYIGNNNAGMTDGSTGFGGVVSLVNSDTRRSVSCYPLKATANPFQSENGTSNVWDSCPHSRYGACNCYDACAFENYQVLLRLVLPLLLPTPPLHRFSLVLSKASN